MLRSLSGLLGGHLSFGGGWDIHSERLYTPLPSFASGRLLGDESLSSLVDLRMSISALSDLFTVAKDFGGPLSSETISDAG